MSWRAVVITERAKLDMRMNHLVVRSEDKTVRINLGEICTTNAALNYGYSIILSFFNREIVANGYLTQLGLFHRNMFNRFNLSCDLMDPFRIIVDRCVDKNKFTIFEKEEKHTLVNILNSTVVINNSEQYLGNAIKIYCMSIFDALNENDASIIQFYHSKSSQLYQR